MHSIKRLSRALVLLAGISLYSCTETNTNSKQEEIEIKTMDSTSSAIKKNTDDLEDKTKKVEESLEKLDKEFANQQ